MNQEGTGCATSGEGIGVGLICRDRPDQEPARDRAVITSCSLQPQAERVRRMSFAQRSSEIGWSTMLSGAGARKGRMSAGQGACDGLFGVAGVVT